MKILLVKTKGAVPLEMKEEHAEQVRATAKDLEVVVADADNKEEVQKHLQDADIVAGAPWALPPVSGAKNLKWVHSFSAGMDRVLTPELVNSDILASNSAGIHATPIAEHVMGFMLMFARRFPATFKKQQQKAMKNAINVIKKVNSEFSKKFKRKYFLPLIQYLTDLHKITSPKVKVCAKDRVKG